MLVYGERVRRAAPQDLLETIGRFLAGIEDEPAAILRHERLVAALIEAGRLAQGLADAAFVERGLDARLPAADAAMELTRTLARKIMAADPSGAEDPATALRFAAVAMPAAGEVPIKTPEGYAYYALYPETYGWAASGANVAAVLGLRSIGTSLAAMVAAGAGAERIVTARPCGDPFARELRLSDDLAADLAVGSVAVVDEGPGLSGSSFGAAMDLLDRLGVPADRQQLFPSHSGEPGAEACEGRRRRWRQAQRRLAPFESHVLPQLPDWFEDLVGPPASPLEDLSGGGWRKALNAEAPVHAAQERRKYLLHTDRGEFLLKFSGLGAASPEKFARARALHAAGFTPEPLALRHGFLLQRWLRDARPLTDPRVNRTRLLDRLEAYLRFRAKRFPAAPDEGAAPAELSEMAAHNARELLGLFAADAVRARLAPLHAARPSPVRIDGRMHAWEWLVLPDGSILKADALDHDDAHDLIGCQDIAWDIAGARVELGLTGAETARLCAAAGADPALLPAFEVAYLAFQAGAWTFALAGAEARDRPPIERLLRGYRRSLARRLA